MLKHLQLQLRPLGLLSQQWPLSLYLPRWLRQSLSLHLLRWLLRSLCLPLPRWLPRSLCLHLPQWLPKLLSLPRPLWERACPRMRSLPPRSSKPLRQ